VGVFYGSAFARHISPSVNDLVASHLVFGVWSPSFISHLRKLPRSAPPCSAACDILQPVSCHIFNDRALALAVSSLVDLPLVQWSRMSPAFISISILSLKLSMHLTALALASNVSVNSTMFDVMRLLRASNAPRRLFDWCVNAVTPFAFNLSV